MRILVTGGNGFIGQHVLQQAKYLGWEVVNLGRQTESAIPVDEYVCHDLSQPLTIEVRPVDAIIHCAALASPWAAPHDFHKANVIGTQNLLDWATQNGRPHFSYVSSSSVFYTDEDQLGLTESSPIPSPDKQINIYSRTKRDGELLVRDYGGPFAIMRPRAVFGPGDTVLLPRVIAAAEKRVLPLFVRPKGQLPVQADLTPVQTIASYIIRATQKNVTGEYNLTNGEPVELYPFLFSILDELNLPRPRFKVATKTAMRLAGWGEALSAKLGNYREPPITRFGVSMFASSKTFDITKTLTDLGRPAISLADGVTSMLADWRSRETR